MGDIPDVSHFLRKIPNTSGPVGSHHNEHTVRFALELEGKRRENERFNKMIGDAVENMGRKVKEHTGKMGRLSKRLMETKDELQDLKVRRGVGGVRRVGGGRGG
jgi:SMC interacting uncharacterized protein involved in chromosome segregation